MLVEDAVAVGRNHCGRREHEPSALGDHIDPAFCTRCKYRLSKRVVCFVILSAQDKHVLFFHPFIKRFLDTPRPWPTCDDECRLCVVDTSVSAGSSYLKPCRPAARDKNRQPKCVRHIIYLRKFLSAFGRLNQS